MLCGKIKFIYKDEKSLRFIYNGQFYSYITSANYSRLFSSFKIIILSQKKDILIRFRLTESFREKVQLATEYFIFLQQEKGLNYTWKNIPSKTKYLSMIFKYLRDFPKLVHTNPAMAGFGGFMFLSKFMTYQHLPKEYLPNTIIFSKNDSIELIEKKMSMSGLHFPCIVKPDKGEQSYGVEYVGNISDLKDYLESALDELLLQEFIEAKKEFGIFVVRDEKGIFRISSLVEKIKPTVTGNGRNSIKELVAKLRLAPKIIERISGSLLEKESGYILESGTSKVVARAGSLYVGVTMKKIEKTIKLEKKMNEILDKFDGFNFGRFDIIADSIFHIEQGDFMILELNGSSAIPLHIHDPLNTVMQNHEIMNQHFESMMDLVCRNMKYVKTEKKNVIQTVSFFIKNIWKQKIPGKSSDFWKISFHIIRLTFVMRFYNV